MRFVVIILALLMLASLAASELNLDQKYKAAKVNTEHQDRMEKDREYRLYHNKVAKLNTGHQDRMEKDTEYAIYHQNARIKKQLKREVYNMNPKLQVEAMLAARKAGVLVSDGVDIRVAQAQATPTLETVIFSDWVRGRIDPMNTTHLVRILDKVEREGLPRAGVLKRWRMLANGCTPGDDSKWCRDFDRAMQCKGPRSCVGSQMVSGTLEDY